MFPDQRWHVLSLLSGALYFKSQRIISINKQVLHQKHSERKRIGFICKVSSIENAKTQRPINHITRHSKTLQHSLYFPRKTLQNSLFLFQHYLILGSTEVCFTHTASEGNGCITAMANGDNTFTRTCDSNPYRKWCDFLDSALFN